jgi:hypothetical protein
MGLETAFPSEEQEQQVLATASDVPSGRWGIDPMRHKGILVVF